MNKQKLFLDCDGTIIDSIQAYCQTYNELYKNHSGFQPAIWYKCEQWDLKDQCNLVENVNTIFSNELFFKYCDFIDRNTQDVIFKLNEKYQVIVCSIGTYSNISLKSQWIKYNLPFIKDSVFLVNKGCKMTKAIVNMEGAIFIDDVLSNLESSNADYKIVFGDEYKWNKTDKYKRCFNWSDIEKLLL